MRLEPALDRRSLVGGVVVDDQVQVQVLGRIAVDGSKEAQELLVTVPGVAGVGDLPGGDFQCGEQAGHFVPGVDPGLPLGDSAARSESS